MLKEAPSMAADRSSLPPEAASRLVVSAALLPSLRGAHAHGARASSQPSMHPLIRSAWDRRCMPLVARPLHFKTCARHCARARLFPGCKLTLRTARMTALASATSASIEATSSWLSMVAAEGSRTNAREPPASKACAKLGGNFSEDALLAAIVLVPKKTKARANSAQG